MFHMTKNHITLFQGSLHYITYKYLHDQSWFSNFEIKDQKVESKI
jgi:hypothetical protein